MDRKFWVDSTRFEQLCSGMEDCSTSALECTRPILLFQFSKRLRFPVYVRTKQNEQARKLMSIKYTMSA